MTTCPAVTIWPDVPPHGVRLACALPAGHDGDHAAERGRIKAALTEGGLSE